MENLEEIIFRLEDIKADMNSDLNSDWINDLDSIEIRDQGKIDIVLLQNVINTLRAFDWGDSDSLIKRNSD